MFYEEVADDETKGCHALVAAWWARHGDETVGVKEIWQLTQGPEGIELDLGDKGERSQRTKLGKMLGTMRDRIFDGRRITAGAAARCATVMLARGRSSLCGSRVVPKGMVNVVNIVNIFPFVHSSLFEIVLSGCFRRCQVRRSTERMCARSSIASWSRPDCTSAARINCGTISSS
jgi:hypothetical protein